MLWKLIGCPIPDNETQTLEIVAYALPLLTILIYQLLNLILWTLDIKLEGSCTPNVASHARHYSQ